MKKFVALCLVLIASYASAEAASVDITACGQVLPPKASATLQIDLTACPGDAPAITLPDRAKLDLNGFSVASGDVGVFCMKRCSIRGPGEITGARDGIVTTGLQDVRLNLRDVDIHDNTEKGISHSGGVEMGRAPRVRVSHVNVTNNGGTGINILQGTITGTDLNVSNNGFLGLGGLLSFKLKRATIFANLRTGLQASYGSGRLVDSLLSLNGTLESDVDISTKTLPLLINTQCGRSSDSATGMTWGACADDVL